MIKFKKSFIKNRTMFIFWSIYFIINLMVLTRFPFVHSDEPWLSGLSRNIADNGSYSVTETFFDLFDRNPHAIKIFFHTIQIIFIKIFGYKIFSIRLASLIFAMLTLYFFYKLCKTIFQSERMAFTASLLLSLDVQYIYASHFARQEIIILFVFIFALYFFYKTSNSHEIKHDIILGVVIGLSIGIHPNSFIISLPFMLIYLYHILFTKKLKIINIMVYGLTLSAMASCFVALSLYLDPHFFYNYSKYGEQFGVFHPVSSKLTPIKEFYFNLYHQLYSGTYYLPNIKFQFFLFGFAWLAALFKLIIKKDQYMKDKYIPILLSIIAINMGTILIGRYNQTSIVFQFPLFYILVINLIIDLKNVYRQAIIAILSLILISNTLYNALPYLDNNYNHYLNQISQVVQQDDTVLANLNCEFYFNNGTLHDYRNLAFLKEKGISFEEYIHKYQIQYIIYPVEMDLIYRASPRRNGLYGNVSYYYNDMQHFFHNHCELIKEFNNKTYGITIAKYINKKDWNIKIYKVQD